MLAQRRMQAAECEAVVYRYTPLTASGNLGSDPVNISVHSLCACMSLLT